MSNEISLAELQLELRSAAPPLLVEVLPPKYFALGHLPGALNLPLETLRELAPELLPDSAARIVVYCSGPTCNNSHVAERALSGAGYVNVRVFRGGKSQWSEAGNSLEVTP